MYSKIRFPVRITTRTIMKLLKYLINYSVKIWLEFLTWWVWAMGLSLESGQRNQSRYNTLLWTLDIANNYIIILKARLIRQSTLRSLEAKASFMKLNSMDTSGITHLYSSYWRCPWNQLWRFELLWQAVQSDARSPHRMGSTSLLRKDW